jgi:hypothetical protein
MSAPADKIHDKIRTGHQNDLKFKKEGEMKMAKQITRVKTVISRGLVTQHPVKLVGILALGVLLMAGTAVHFAPESDVEVGNPASVGPAAEVGIYPEDDPYAYLTLEEFDRAVAPKNAPNYNQLIPNGSKFNANKADPKLHQDVTESFGQDVVAALGYEVLTARLNQYQADGGLTSRDMERLDQEIDMLLVAAANKSSAARAAFNREVERLEEKISSLLAEASRNPSTNVSQLNREIDRLDDQINTLQLAAKQKQ